ncbi:MAG: SAM-dependent methyltransferase [Firmicutes bacterium]|nr:SAM-dependent methyltransferase [Bacillota bacterium]
MEPRLERLAEMVRPGWGLAEIAANDAIFSATLVKRGIIPYAIASDIGTSPVLLAQRRVWHDGLSARIAVRQGDGLTPIAVGEVPQVAIAGIGGLRMTRLLEAGRPQLRGVHRLVLQPMGHEYAVRFWLSRQGWRIAEEHFLWRRQHGYFFMSAERGVEVLSPNACLLGPRLMEHPPESYVAFAQEEVVRLRHRLAGQGRSVSAQGDEAFWQDALVKAGEVVMEWSL